jgi:hypothetical protein
MFNSIFGGVPMGGQVNVDDLAVSYRRLVLWFGVQLVFGLFGAAIQGMAVAAPELALVLMLVRLGGLLITIVALVIYAYRTAKALGSTAAVVWGVAMLIPCLNAITLLLISSRAQAACKEAGIPVGFFGPKI